MKIGDVGKVELKEGRAVVELEIHPKYKDLVREDATALLRPKTALKDMFIEVEPGDGKPARDGLRRSRSRNTLPDVNPDEVLATLDDDTRDYLQACSSTARAQGLKGRGDDLREVFERFEPTHRDLARVTTKVAERRENLRRLVTNLNRLNGELGEQGRRPRAARRLVGRACSARSPRRTRTSPRRSSELPDGAASRRRDTLGKVETFANILRPVARAARARPCRGIDEANERARAAGARRRTPIVRDEIRPFVREARPLVRDLRPRPRVAGGRRRPT